MRAATILAEIGVIDRIDHAKKLVTFAGVDPSVYASGKFKSRGMAQGGFVNSPIPSSQRKRKINFRTIAIIRICLCRGSRHKHMRLETKNPHFLEDLKAPMFVSPDSHHVVVVVLSS